MRRPWAAASRRVEAAERRRGSAGAAQAKRWTPHAGEGRAPRTAEAMAPGDGTKGATGASAPATDHAAPAAQAGIQGWAARKRS